MLYDEIKSQVRLVLRNALKDYPSNKIIFEEQSGLEPNSTYCTVDILSLDQLGLVEKSVRVGTDLQLQHNTAYNLLVQFTFIGKLAPTLAYTAHSRLGNSTSNREYAQSFNLSIKNKTQVRDTSQKRDTKYVSYLSFDATFFFISGFTETVGVINQIVYEDGFTQAVVEIPPTITP